MFEAYTVAVRVSLLGSRRFITELGAIGAAFTKVHGGAEKFNAQLKKTRALMLGGLAVGAAGVLGLEALKFPIEQAAKFRHEIEMLKTAGVGPAQVAAASRAAWATQRSVPTTTPTENLQALAELRTVLGQLRDERGNRIVEHATERAAQILPTIQKMNYILENALDERGYSGKAAGHQAYVAAKMLELRGATKDMGEFVQEADMLTKAIIATRGRVRPQDFLSAVMYGRRAGYSWSNHFMYEILPTLIQEMQGYGSGGGGVRGPGNALMSAYAAIVGGTIPKKDIPYWQQAGLLGAMHKGKRGAVSFDSMKGYQVFEQDPNEWAKQFLIPFYQRKGWIDKNDVNKIINPEEIRAYQQHLFPNRTASIMDTMVMRQFLFQRDVPLYRQSMGINKGYAELVSRDPMALLKQTEASFTSLMTLVGQALLPTVNRGLQGLTRNLQDLIKWATAHPRAMSLLVKGFAALSVAAVVAGGVLMLAGIVAFISLPVVAATLAFTGLAAGIAFLFPKAVALGREIRLLANGLTHVAMQGFRATGHVIAQVMRGIRDGVKEGWAFLQDQFANGWSVLKSGVLNFFHSIFQWIRDHGGKLVAGFMTGPGTRPDLYYNGGAQSPFIAGPAPHTIQTHTHITMDGRVVADVVSRHQAKGMGYGAASGRHDPRASLAAAGAGYHR